MSGEVNNGVGEKTMSWPMVAIKDVAKVITGKTPSKQDDENFNGNIPFVTPAELSGEAYVGSSPQTITEKGAKSVKLIPVNSVMVCCIGSLGKIGIANSVLATNQQINSVIFDLEKVDPKYGYYALQRLKPLMEKLAPSTTVAIINKSNFEALEIPLPPLAEQQRIAAILDKADAIRRKRQQAIQLADEFLRAVFLDMFGDPVTNPKDWEMKKLGEITKKITDGEHQNPEFVDYGQPMVMAKNVSDSGVDFEGVKYISHSDNKKFRIKCAPVNGDLLLVGRGATIGRCCIVKTDVNFSLMGSVILIKPKESILTSEFLIQLLKIDGIRNRMTKVSSSSAQEAIYLSHLKELCVPAPPYKEQVKFSHIREKVTSLLKVEKLVDDIPLFESLSQKAFKGFL